MTINKYIGYRPTWAEVNLANLVHNLNQVRSRLRPGVKVMVTVKADAYGHGLVPVSRQLISAGVEFLGVASIDEGIKLREARINAPVLILGLVLKKDIGPLFQYRLTPTVCDLELAVALNQKAKFLNTRQAVHIKVDTGMGRVGVLHEDAFLLVRKIQRLSRIDIEGIFTHFAFADINQDFTRYQLLLFNRLVERLRKLGVNIPLVHAANSMGLLDYQDSHFNLVRPGLVIYGLYPKEGLSIRLKPVLSLKTKIVLVKKIPKGYGISYGHAYVTDKDTLMVVLPIGYGDGYPRNLSNLASVLIKGKRFKISGRICMDQMMVDVGNLAVKTAEEVILIGRQGKNRITVEELAGYAGTISYEIVCGLGSRIPRVYIKEG
ncbi:MAG: alanine racemase [Candidatus Omnitrophota bacterium]